MFVRVVKGSSKTYVLIVRSFRDKEGKSRQETVLNLGPVQEGKDAEERVALAKRMIAHLDAKQIILDGAEIQETLRQNWGAPALMDQLWQRFTMHHVIQGRKAEALKLMMMDRLLTPRSKLKTYENRHRYAGIPEIDRNHLYRTLDHLAENADAIKQHIYAKQALLGVSEVVFFDVRRMYFESQQPDLLCEFG